MGHGTYKAISQSFFFSEGYICQSYVAITGLMNAQESDITSVMHGKLRLFPSSPKERKQKMEYITQSIH